MIVRVDIDPEGAAAEGPCGYTGGTGPGEGVEHQVAGPDTKGSGHSHFAQSPTDSGSVAGRGATRETEPAQAKRRRRPRNVNPAQPSPGWQDGDRRLARDGCLMMNEHSRSLTKATVGSRPAIRTLCSGPRPPYVQPARRLLRTATGGTHG